jgi:TatD DNase family protein
MLIDTHSHLNFNAYKNDYREVIFRSLSRGLWFINVGSQYDTSKRAVEIAEDYPEGVYAAIGLHPIHLASGIFKTKIDEQEVAFNTREEEFNVEKYLKLTESKKVVAIGEIGLDYYYRPKTKSRLEEFKSLQKEILLKQLELAKISGLPVIFHCRMAHDELIEILQQQNGLTGVIHCFTGTLDQAEKYLKMGFYLGLNGIIFKLDMDNVIKEIPLEKIVLETDCPYLTPLPMQGRNEPLYVEYVAKKVAELKRETIEKISEITTSNAKKLFKI